MSSFTHDNNAGSVFRNDKKQKDAQPDFTGSMVVDGVEYWASMWTVNPKAGKKGYFSIKLSSK